MKYEEINIAGEPSCIQIHKTKLQPTIVFSYCLSTDTVIRLLRNDILYDVPFIIMGVPQDDDQYSLLQY